MVKLDLQTQKFGHKIEPLMNDALAKGLKIGPLAAGEIMLLDEAHRKYWARYPHEQSKPIFVIEDFEPYVVELLRAVAGSIRGPGISPPYVTY